VRRRALNSRSPVVPACPGKGGRQAWEVAPCKESSGKREGRWLEKGYFGVVLRRTNEKKKRVPSRTAAGGKESGKLHRKAFDTPKENTACGKA